MKEETSVTCNLYLSLVIFNPASMANSRFYKPGHSNRIIFDHRNEFFISISG